MFSFFMTIFIFLAVAVLFTFLVIGSLLSRGRKQANPPQEDPNVIDVQAIDVDEDEAAVITSTDQLLKP